MVEPSEPRAPLTLEDPLDMDDARRAAHQAQRYRGQLEADLEQAIDEAATAEDAYRSALAKRIIYLRNEYPATVCKDLAKGEDNIVALRHTRDVARDRKDKLIPEKLKGAEGTRAMLRQLMEWSKDLNVQAARAA